jgi:gas vesicle protein
MEDTWIYFVGPLIGALIGAAFFLFIKPSIVAAHGVKELVKNKTT